MTMMTTAQSTPFNANLKTPQIWTNSQIVVIIYVKSI